jgi:hypothetical protein
VRSAVLVPVILATLAAMPTANAGVEAKTTAPASMHLADPPAAAVALAAHDVASPPPESVPAAGGALFSPFDAPPAKPTRREPPSAAYQSTGGAGLTISVAAALAALAAIGFILRRVSR